MFRINIPQHCGGRLIAHGASGFVLKANRFQGDRVKLALSRPARLAYPATEAISGAIAEKRKFLVRKCEQALD
jgi:hypothetical protein